MAYFPFFMDITDRPALIVGGGAVALRKVRKLIPYRPRLTVAAPEIVPELAAIPGLALRRRPFRPEDLDGMDFVIAATSEREVNREIAALCRERRVPVNAVDDREACSFLFPCLVQRGPLSVGISTGGASPTAAIWLKEQVAELLPERLEDILDYLEALRPRLKAGLTSEQRRAAAFSALFQGCLEAGRPLTPEEETALLTPCFEIRNTL